MKRIAFVLLTLHAAPLAAQQYDSISPRLIVERAKRGNWYLRIHGDSVAVEGRVTFLHGDTAASLGRQKVRFDDVSRIERRAREGSAAGSAAIGSGILAGGFFMVWATGWCEGDCNSAAILGAGAGFGLGAVVGGLLGLAISPGELRWRSIWPDSIARVAQAEAAQADTRPRGRSKVVAQIGTQVLGDRDIDPPLPTFFSLHISRDHEAFEITPLGFTVAFADGEAGFFALESGFTYQVRAPLFVGATAGLGADFDKAKPVFSLRTGIAKPTARFRVEFRVSSPVLPELHPSGHVLIGYSMRPWRAR